MNIFLREMKAHRKSLIIWVIVILFMVISGMAKYETYQASGQTINDVMAKMPYSLKIILGFGSFDLSKASGFYGLLYLYLILMATIHASMLGAGIISKEERDKTAEFLIAKPVSRTTVITSKLAAAFLNIVVFNLANLIFSIAIVNKYSKGENVTKDIIILMIGMLFLQILFFSIGTFTASVSKRPKTAVAIATGVLLSTYILSVIIDLNSKLEVLKYITPFKYFEAKNMMYGKGLSPLFTVLSLIITIALIAMTYLFYTKRDLKV